MNVESEEGGEKWRERMPCLTLRQITCLFLFLFLFCGHPLLISFPSHSVRPSLHARRERYERMKVASRETVGSGGTWGGRKRPKEPPFTSNFIPLGLFLPRSGPSPYGSLPVPIVSRAKRGKGNRGPRQAKRRRKRAESGPLIPFLSSSHRLPTLRSSRLRRHGVTSDVKSEEPVERDANGEWRGYKGMRLEVKGRSKMHHLKFPYYFIICSKG